MLNARGKMAMVMCAVVAAVVVAGCPWTFPFQVTFPAAEQSGSQDFGIGGSNGNKLVITVQFTRAVDMDSLIPGTNVVLDTEQDNNADITIAAGSNSREIVITSVADYTDLLVFDPDGYFALHMRGSGDNPVRSATGDILDGDNDGEAGGDYWTNFVIIG